MKAGMTVMVAGVSAVVLSVFPGTVRVKFASGKVEVVPMAKVA